MQNYGAPFSCVVLVCVRLMLKHIASKKLC